MKYLLYVIKFLWEVVKAIIIILGTIILLYMLFTIFDEKDFCLDTGVCKEGLELNTKNGYIIINENSCKENDGTWDTKYRRCKFKYK